VMAVRRSHLEDVGDIDKPCHRAVFMRNGVLGSSSFRRAEGEASMVVDVLRGVMFFSFVVMFGPDAGREGIRPYFLNTAESHGVVQGRQYEIEVESGNGR